MGHVTDITTGQALPGVTVTLDKGAIHRLVKTDTHGAYRFAGIPDGTYTLTLQSKDVPAASRAAVVHGSTRLDLAACSTTLDYSCAAGGPGSGSGR
jgi:hypothetical protein